MMLYKIRYIALIVFMFVLTYIVRLAWWMDYKIIAVGMFIALLGSVCNLIVLTFNKCKMPVYKFYEYYKTYPKHSSHFHYSDSEKVNLSFLSDRFLIFFNLSPKFWGLHLIFSMGDVLVVTGVIVCVFGIFI